MKNEERKISETTIKALRKIGKISLQKLKQGRLLQATPVIMA